MAASDIDKHALKLINKLAYVRAFLSQGIRPDGRGLGDSRPLNVRAGVCELSFGSALVHAGSTKVCASITLEIGQPDTHKPNEGEITFDVSLGGVCGPQYAQATKHEDAHSLETFLGLLLHKSAAFDLQQLCIEPGRAAWRVHIHLTFLSVGGQLFDAGSLAAFSALLDLRLPRPLLQPDGTYHADTKHSTRPQLSRFPVPLSCAVFDNPTVILPDPSGDETDVCSSVVTVAVDEHEHVCAVKSVGSLALTQAQLQQCIELSQTHARDVAAHIEQAFQHAYGKPTLL